MTDFGYLGLFDWTGIPTGPEGEPAPASSLAGFYGLLDFTGIPTGQPTTGQLGHAPKVGGRYFHLIQVLAERKKAQTVIMKSLLDYQLRKQVFQKRLDEAQERHRRHVASLAVFLAEV